MPAKGMPQQLAISVFLSAAVTRRHPLVDFASQGITLPLLAAAKLFARQVAIRAHDRAPKIASQIDCRFEFSRRGVVSAGNVDVLKPIVIKVGELPAPRPTGLSHR